MKLSIKEKLGYSLGDTASHFVWDLVNFWLIFYYTDVLGISPAWSTAIAILGTIMDAVMDPIVGIWADRTNTRWGKFRPFLLFGCIPFALFAFLAFFGPDLQGNALIAYILPMFIGLRVVYAIVNIPYSSLGAVMTDDSIERAGLNSYRFVAANLGQLIVSGFALYIVYYLGSHAAGMDYSIMADDAARKVFMEDALANSALVRSAYIIGFRYLVAIFGCVGIILFLITFFSTRERVAPPKRQDAHLGRDFKYLFVALIIAIPTTKPLVKKFGAKQLYIVCSILSGFFFCMLFFAGKNFVLINIFNCLGKIAYAPAISLLWTMLADAADYGEWKFQRRTTGLCLSAAVFAQKIGWSIGAALFGVVMSMIGYNADLLTIDQIQHTPLIMNTFHWMFGIVPGVLYASCAIFLAFYNLDNATMEQMKNDLAESRK